MKLRIHNNSIRLRLTRSEVNALACGEFLEARLDCIPEPLAYRIEPLPISEMTGTFARGVLTIRVPLHQVSRWAQGDAVEIESTVVGSNNTKLHLLIEKDFQCLHGVAVEQEDCFPNPNAVG